jgi:dTDP-4-amino-4,6-dideoxygalactose transaminase
VAAALESAASSDEPIWPEAAQPHVAARIAQRAAERGGRRFGVGSLERHGARRAGGARGACRARIAVVAVGATPVFCDVDERFQADVDDMDRRVTPRTKALLPVHWAGASPDMVKVMDLAQSHGLLVLEDACMAIGGKVHGQSPGTFGDMGAFSMHPLKTLNVMGDGGMVITQDEDRMRWMLKYRNHGMVDRDHIDMWGVNMRLQPLQAVVASHMLTSLDERLARRREIQRTYDEQLCSIGPSIVVPPRVDWNPETVSLYMFQADNRDDLIAHLVANGVEAKVHYPVPLHLQKPGHELGYRSGDLPVAESQATRLVTLPAHEYLTEPQVKMAMGVVEDALARR